MKWLGRAASLLLACIAATPLLTAQNPRGSLRGVVQDASGGRVSGATIIVTSADFSTERQTKSSDRGEFRVADLLPGEYRVRVEATAFAAAESRVEVQVSSGRDINVTLKPAGVHQEVNVSAEGSSITTQPVDVASAVQQGIVTAQDLREIPLAHRSFANRRTLAAPRRHCRQGRQRSTPLAIRENASPCRRGGLPRFPPRAHGSAEPRRLSAVRLQAWHSCSRTLNSAHLPPLSARRVACLPTRVRRDGAIEGRPDQSVALGRFGFLSPLGLEPNFAGLAPASRP